MCMRKFQSFAFAGAIALAGVAGFSACSSDDAVEAPINPTFDGESVKAAFAISLPGATGTRMSAGEAQEGGGISSFLGMKDIYLFPFQSVSDIAGTTIIDKNAISLAVIEKTGLNTYQTANKKVYSDVSFDLGVNKFLFYGQAKDTKGEGVLNASYLNTKINNNTKVEDAIKFTLAQAYNISGDTESPTNILSTLNGIVQKLDASSESDVTALSTSLKDLTAGSATSVLKALEDLYNSLAKLNKQDVVADYIATGKTLVPSGSAVPYTLAWDNSKVKNYPNTVGLPDGAVALKWDTNQFKYDESTSVEGLNITARTNYMKPAALYYFVNSPAMVSNSTHTTELNSTSSDDWSSIQTLYTEGAVAASTQSVIIKDEIQYGVACLKSTVKIKANTTLYDSGDGTNPANIVTVPNAGYKVTGILVGGQPKTASWDFTSSGSEEYTVYDGVFNKADNVVTYDEACTPNYTLLLETTENLTTGVNVAIELENTGSDFYGKDHKLIPAGSKFYLVGKLVNTNNTGAGAATDTNANKIFLQDFTTSATFTIGATSLADAYNVIPDLRSPKLEFGLSVDLRWQSGLTFEVDL